MTHLPPELAAALIAQSPPAAPAPVSPSEAYNEGDYDARWGKLPDRTKYADPQLQAEYERGHRQFDVKAYLAGFDSEPVQRRRQSDEAYFGVEPR